MANKRRVGRTRGRGGYGRGSARPGGRPTGRGGNRRRSSRRSRQEDYGPDNGEPTSLQPGSGVLEMHPNGYGFLRNPATNFTRERSDPFVPGTMIEKFGLREGLLIHGMVQPQRRQQGPRLREILDVDGMPPDDYLNIKEFDERKIEVEWERVSPKATKKFSVTARLTTNLFSEIEGTLRKYSGNIIRGKLDDSLHGILKGFFTVELEKKDDFRKVLKDLRTIPEILTIQNAN